MLFKVKMFVIKLLKCKINITLICYTLAHKLTISSIQFQRNLRKTIKQTQYPLRTITDKLWYVFLKKKQLTFIKYTANLTTRSN